MNPSASDWITKYLSILAEYTRAQNFPAEITFYNLLKRSGFIYGVSLRGLLDTNISTIRLTREEFTKVNLFHALLQAYVSETNTTDYEAGIESILQFYDSLDKGKTGFLAKITLPKSPSQKLEKVLAARLQETNTLLNKGVSGILTYALLYVDVLTYRHALKSPETTKSFSEDVESTVITCCYLALNSKKKKSKYDRLLIELFESSAHYLSVKTAAKGQGLERLSRLKTAELLERKYLLDIATITVWDDHRMDEEEWGFLKELTKTIDLEEEDLNESMRDLATFMADHETSMKLFEYANPVKLFYKQSTSTVKLLILRNKRRLLKELEQSGELLVLLTESTLRELSEDEKHKVKQQILDICKTIPSLAVFLLPGGSVLLPILIKFYSEDAANRVSG